MAVTLFVSIALYNSILHSLSHCGISIQTFVRPWMPRGLAIFSIFWFNRLVAMVISRCARSMEAPILRNTKSAALLTCNGGHSHRLLREKNPENYWRFECWEVENRREKTCSLKYIAVRPRRTHLVNKGDGKASRPGVM
jgi:hypothetical protein